MPLFDITLIRFRLRRRRAALAYLIRLFDACIHEVDVTLMLMLDAGAFSLAFRRCHAIDMALLSRCLPR